MSLSYIWSETGNRPLPSWWHITVRATILLCVTPPHDKTNKIICAPSLIDSDQPGHPPPRLIWVFAGHTCHIVGFVMWWLICHYERVSGYVFMPQWAYHLHFSAYGGLLKFDMKIFVNVARLEIGQLFTQGTRWWHPCTLDTFLVFPIFNANSALCRTCLTSGLNGPQKTIIMQNLSHIWSEWSSKPTRLWQLRVKVIRY